jgi:hypothetical protein
MDRYSTRPGISHAALITASPCSVCPTSQRVFHCPHSRQPLEMPLHHRGFSCWINCDGEQLREYQQITGDNGAKIAWIASELGKVRGRYFTVLTVSCI